MTDLIDKLRYPIDQPDSPRGIALIERCREQLD